MKQINILLADDDDDDRLFFIEAIEQLDLAISLDWVVNGVELLTYLKRPDTLLPELIFLDLNMPIKGGIECLVEIRRTEILKNLSVAIYSTSNAQKDIDDCLIHGANIYIKKPSDFEILKSIIYKAITRNHQYHSTGLSKDNFLMVI
ncbi:response regulator [Algoriphagus sp. AGSA1]|uniref:response regulator n=1 Tax=Algoriphagus sp. AGSA1 TaxID=2907213 RepID=UPI001F2FD501|nr:response regulator [Algoriphagus sp. AGSA1]MCE7054663.1 response regulator [Algoriphagus sp. AGSA1]